MLRDQWCPFCGAEHDEDCEHFLGWTDTGHRIDDPKQGRSAACTPEPILPTDRIVTTGVSARVYRP